MKSYGDKAKEKVQVYQTGSRVSWEHIKLIPPPSPQASFELALIM